jgi:hypothetical protein
MVEARTHSPCTQAMGPLQAPRKGEAVNFQDYLDVADRMCVSNESTYLAYQRRQAQELRAQAEHDRRIRVIRNQPRNPKARKNGRASAWNRSPAGSC